MRRCIRPLLSVVILVLWLVSGPVAMAFDGCAMMGAVCEARCGVLSCIVAPTGSDMGALQPLAFRESRSSQRPARTRGPHRRPGRTGRAPEEGEDQITYPLTVSLQGLPGVRVVRSSSAFGFSMINVIFEDDVDLYFARSRVLERLNLLTKSLPGGVIPTLGPDATGVGHVFWYTVEGQGTSLRDLRSLQDWFIRYQLNAVPGVAEVASIGGTVRQYQIDVDPNRLRAYRIPLSAVVDAVMRSNRNVG